MRRGKDALIAAFSCLFSACVTIGRHIVFSGDVYQKLTQNHMSSLSALDALLFACLAGLVFLALRTLQAHMGRVEALCLCPRRRQRPVRFACLAALCLLLAWLPYLLTVAPGNIYVDSLESIGQMLEHGHPISNHHPMFYTLMVGVFLKMGAVLFDSYNIGVLLYSLFQTAVMIGCITLVLTILYERQVRGWIIAVSMAYFMFMPCFPSYAMSMWKDALFSCMLLLLCVLLYALTQQERVGMWWPVCYGVVGVGAMMMRNNGVYVFAATSVLALWLQRRHARKLLAAAAAALAVFISLSGLITYVWNIHGDFVENLGIPLQQLGYTINEGGTFTAEEEEYLYALMPRDVWAYAYRPCLVDTIKWNPFFDYGLLLETKGTFFRVWLGGLVKNPVKYVRAYLLATFGFWKPGVQNWYGYMDVQMQDNAYGIGFMDLFERLFGFSLMPILKDYPVILGSGTLLWLVLLGCTLTVLRRKAGLAPYLPALLNWATVMIATPVAFSLRYVFVFALGLPFFLTLPLMIAQKRDAETGQSLDTGGRIAYNISDIRR